MKTYAVIPEFVDRWGSAGKFPVIVTDADIDSLAGEWEIDRAELLEQVEEFDRRYMITVTSDSTYTRTYYSDSRDAMKAAHKYGRCEGGEEIRVYNRRGEFLSGAEWTPEDGGKYYRIYR